MFEPESSSPSLPKTERRDFELLVNSISDYAIFMLDVEGCVQSWNKGAQKLKGYQEAEILGQSIARFYAPEDVAAGKPQRLLETARREGHVEDEGWRVRKDGTRFWANVVITALHDEQGALIGFGKVTRDLTARKRLEQQHRQFELLVKGISDYGIFLLSPEGTISTWNEAAQRLKGYTEAEVVGKHYAIFYTPEDRAAHKPERLLETARREGHVEDEGWRVRKDGTRFWADVVITAIYDDDRTLIGFGKVTRDLTERRKAELLIAERNEELVALNETLEMQTEELSHQAEELALANEELSQADQLKDQFLSILSHELRTPLNAVLGFASVLDDEVIGPLTPDQHRYLGRIMGGTEILLTLINDLLDMSRIQAGKFSLSPQAVNLEELAKNTLTHLTALAQQKQQSLVLDTCDDLPLVQADQQRISQVVLNLVGNAIKFTPGGGLIEVRLRRCPGTVRVEVEDNGIGISEADQARLFQPFTQVDSSSTRAAGGTGLGLSISRALVEAHGGQIGVTSMPGEGSTFWFTLPLSKQA